MRSLQVLASERYEYLDFGREASGCSQLRLHFALFCLILLYSRFRVVLILAGFTIYHCQRCCAPAVEESFALQHPSWFLSQLRFCTLSKPATRRSYVIFISVICPFTIHALLLCSSCLALFTGFSVRYPPSTQTFERFIHCHQFLFVWFNHLLVPATNRIYKILFLVMCICKCYNGSA